MGFGGEHVAIPFSEGGRTLAQIDEDIEDGAGGDPDEFALGRRAALVVEPAEDILCGAAVIVLHEIGVDSELGESFLVPALEKKSASVAENAGTEEKRSVDFCGVACHLEKFGMRNQPFAARPAFSSRSRLIRPSANRS